MSKYFGFTSLTGGGTGALDAIDGSVLTVGDIAVGVSSNESFTYVLDGSGDMESSPDVISPDTSAGSKRWKRVHDEDKAYRANSPTNGNIAEVDADGDVVDSGIASSVIDGLGAITGDKGKVPVVNNTETGYDMVALPNRNLLINGCFRVAQRGTSFTAATLDFLNSDDKYTLDRWTLLSDGNDIVDVTQSTERPTTKFLNSIALDVETANKKFGIIQFVENQNAEYVIGDTVVFSFYAKVSSTTKLDNIKAAIISWSSTADSVTSDIISAWGAENVNPTLVANWTFENTPANLSVTTSWARYSVSATIDTASTTNIAVFIWSDVTDTTTGDFLYISGCQLELGSTPTTFEYRPISTEVALCQRYYEKSFNLSIRPATNTGSSVGAIGTRAGAINTSFRVTAYFKTTKRDTPTMTFWNPDADNDQWNVGGVSADSANVGQSSFVANATAPSIAAGAATSVHWTASSEL